MKTDKEKRGRRKEEKNIFLILNRRSTVTNTNRISSDTESGKCLHNPQDNGEAATR